MPVLASVAVAAVMAAVPGVVAPPANGVFDYQIGGAYPPAARVTIVDRDRSDPPVAGRYNVCYVNAFQAQPGRETRYFQRLHDDLLLRDAAGRYVIDRDWNEILFDTRTAAKRATLARLVGKWFKGCADAGYQAVEPDNLDSWSRSKKLITTADNVAMAKLLAAKAHALRLAIAQKNASEIAATGRDSIGFDFAIAEECQRYTGEHGRECDDYTHVYGDQVYEVEYVDNGGVASFKAACKARGAKIAITYRDRDVVPPSDPAYTFDSC